MEIEKIKKQGFVWVKTKNGITKDKIAYNFTCKRTIWNRIPLIEQNYGKPFAITKEELDRVFNYEK